MRNPNTIGLAGNPAGPDADDVLTRYIEDVEQDGMADIEEAVADDQDPVELVRVLADASKTGLLQRIAEGRPLDDRDEIQIQAFRALIALADQLEQDRNERVLAEAESRREDAAELAGAP